MDRKEIDALLLSGSITVTMNDGSVHAISSDDHPACSDISLSYLHRDDEDGRWRHVHLPLVTMASVVSDAPTS